MNHRSPSSSPHLQEQALVCTFKSLTVGAKEQEPVLFQLEAVQSGW